MSRVESDEDDTAELAAVVLNNGEFIRRRNERFETLYKQFKMGGRIWYKCLVCNNPSVKWLYEDEGECTRYLMDMKIHCNEEHLDKFDEVKAEMRREVLARKRANYGVEDPVRWEEYYKTNCKLRRPF